MAVERRVAAAIGLAAALVALAIGLAIVLRSADGFRDEVSSPRNGEREASGGPIVGPRSPTATARDAAASEAGSTASSDETREPLGAARDARPTRVRGGIVEASDGKSAVRRPIPGATVRLVNAEGEAILETAPDATGEFEIEVADPPLPGFGVRVTAPGYRPFERRGDLAAGRDNDLGSIELHPGGRIAGRVLDDAGRPLRAEVSLYSGGDGERPFVTLIDVVDGFLASAPEIARTATDASGRFVFDSLAESRYSIRARSPSREDGFAGGIVIAAWQRSEEREIRMRPGSVISGRVTDPDGSPVAGCRVIAILAGDGWPPPDVTYPSVTGPDGRYTIAGLPLARLSVIVPTPDGAISLSRQVFPPVHGLDVTLEPRARITGVVKDRDTDEPIAGAQVFGLTPDLSVSIVRTDPAGRFALSLSRSDGSASLAASAAGYADRSESVGLLSLTDPVDCTIYLEHGVELRGTVVRRDDGTPVPNASVTASAGGIGDGMLSRARTDESGSFVVIVSPGRVRLRVGDVRGLAQDARQTPLEVTVDAATPPDRVTIELVPPGRIQVSVVRASGEPAAGARVTLLGLPPGENRGPWTTDDTGLVDRHPVASGASMTAVAEARDGSIGFSDACPVRGSVEGGPSELRVVLATPATVRGRVVDAATGFAVGGAVATFEPRQLDNRPDLTAERAYLSSRSARAISSEDGRFELVVGLAGSGDLIVMADGFSPHRANGVTCTSEEREIEVSLRTGLELSGRVVDASDSPIAGAWISVESPGAPPFILRSAVDGTFATHAAPTPPLTLRASHPGHREQSLHIKSEIDVKNELTMRLSKLRE